MPTRSRKGKDNGNAQQHEGSLPRGDEPVVVERGKKFAAYDKFGKLIILYPIFTNAFGKASSPNIMHFS